MKASPAIEVAEQFDDLQQQRETADFGMWVFIGTEVMLFGGLFFAFTVYRTAYPDAFREAAGQLNVVAGSINTFLLLIASFLFSLAISTHDAGRRILTLALLGGALVLGTAFLVIKGYEYHEEWTKGLWPGPGYRYAGAGYTQAQLFFVLYFVTTGLHAVHLLIGLGIILVYMGLVVRSLFRKDREVALEIAGLYWHFVDFVWIFVFAAFYLLGGKPG